MGIFKKHWLIASITLAIFFTRLLVFNQAASYFWADERHFRELIDKLNESSKKHDFMIAVHKIFNLNARPGFGLFYYPAAILEWKNPNIPFGAYYNVVINSLILILIYLIVKKIHNNKAAVLALILVSFTTASVIYMRHLLPYDSAFFLLLLGLFIYIYTKKLFTFGLLLGLSFLTYANYYYILPIPAVLFLFYRSIKPAFLFTLGVAAILMLTNIASMILTNTSYFTALKLESAGVTSVGFGDYVFAFSFIIQYIFEIDGFWNTFLIIISAIFVIFLRKDKKIHIFGTYLILIFLTMEMTSHILKMHVLYGRTIRVMYILILVFVAMVLEKMLAVISKSDKKIYFILFFLIIFLTLLNGLPRFVLYKNLVYPTQFKNEAKKYLKEQYVEPVKLEEALFVNYFGIDSPPKMNIFKEFKEAEPWSFYIVNANVIYPYYGSYDLNLFCKNDVLLKEPHVQFVYRPYLFEGWNKTMREQSVKDPIYYQLIFCKSQI